MPLVCHCTIDSKYCRLTKFTCHAAWSSPAAAEVRSAENRCFMQNSPEVHRDPAGVRPHRSASVQHFRFRRDSTCKTKGRATSAENNFAGSPVKRHRVLTWKLGTDEAGGAPFGIWYFKGCGL